MYNIIQGDCLQEMDKLILDGTKVDMILTDPPYGTTACKWDNCIPFEPMWDKINSIIKPKRAICLFGNEPFSSRLRCSNLADFKYDWVWEKTTPTGFLNAKRQPLRVVEMISIFYKKQALYNPQMIHDQIRKVSLAKHKIHCISTDDYGKHGLSSYDSTDRYPKNLLIFKSDKQKCSFHPTQKPVDLLEYLIKTYTNEGDTVLDFTMGSGSTGVACINTNRNFIGIELDQKYYNIAKSRLEEAK